MVLMALDHTRWFFTNISFQPEELERTDIWLFLTRWLTHFCAPGFFLLAGMGIFLYAEKVKDKHLLSRYLLSRGVLLVLLELTIVGYSWEFTPFYSFGGVIWALGWSFILFAGLVYLPERALLFSSICVLLFHNNLDGFTLDESGWVLFLWRMLYAPGQTDDYFILFSLIPWLAIMVLGFTMGRWYLKQQRERKRIFLVTGLMFVAAFFMLRLTNFYGNPDSLFISPTTTGHFNVQSHGAKTVISFLNTEKYPPSLLFLLMTLGPTFLWLGTNKADSSETPGVFFRTLNLFGRVPLFFYILHLYLIHSMALLLGLAASRPVDWLVKGGSRTEGSGFGLGVVYVMWIVALGILYPFCKWYENYKRNHDYAWLKYL